MQLFRVRGIPVRIDSGWFLIFGLISWSLASGYFPHVLPSQSPAAYWAQGVIAALLLFASVLLHELAHALVAIRHGVPVGAITLHIFGGVSQLDSEPETPRAELLIAVVGPLTSFAIAGAAYVLGRLVSGPAWAQALGGYVAAVNAVVGVFNLVPAFPLDGGRVLRAALWWWRRDLRWASRVASGVGSGLALIMVAVGLMRAVLGEVVGGLWFALIGVFLHQAARSTYETVRLRSALDALRVADVMNTAPAVLATMTPWREAAVSPRDSAWDALLRITRNGKGRVAVVEAGTLVGVVTQGDLQQLIATRAQTSTRRRAA
jgi:Zn-dependent protease